ncbi:MAG: uroporphyrinogen decarboxylase [Saprospiraceae bacterium]|nr:uroporphyrinogen decarboxylase [Saprospiraceae bacterium]NNL91410.1 uroporphyrinogen decarboxylase [Saprospiraceae bacterium]
MIQNDLLLRTIRKEKVERPPIWLMRQAGRILPEYRAIRSSLSGFVELVTTPHLAAEVTIQPVDRLGVDAAIIFSDILVIPECMGLPYELIEKKGPYFPRTISSAADISALEQGEVAAEKLDYVFKAIEITKKSLNDRVPLIGFSGAPWTLLCYMIEGQGSKTFSKAKGFLYKETKLAHQLLQKLTDTIIAYLKLKIKAGVDVVQVFDSWAGMLDKQLYRTFCIPYLKQIVDAIQDVPVIAFSKGAFFSLEDITELDADVIGLDWTIDPSEFRSRFGKECVVQGNLDPCALYGSKHNIEAKAENLIKSFEAHHIFNLGHGVYPDTPLDNVKHLVNFVKQYKYQ